MAERVLSGSPASPGVALGASWRPAPAIETGALVPLEQRATELATAELAISAAAQQLTAVAAGLGDDDAAIVETGALMGQDPALADAVARAILSEGRGAAEAILGATGAYADAIAAIGDETLAARADDVRSLGRRAARLVTGSELCPPAGSGLILIAADLGPGDVAELAPALAGIGLAAGGATAHAAIVARSLGIPMVTALGAAMLELTDGEPLVLDGSGGELVIDPSVERAEHATGDMRARRRARLREQRLRDRPAVTADGVRIAVLANVASPEELAVGLAAGAEGIGLLRTELAFLEASGWPSEREHRDAIAPILAGLGERPAVIRVLDFGADKAPPFLSGEARRGLELLLAHPDAFARQARAILQAGREHDVRILLPMVGSAEQMERTRTLLEGVASGAGTGAVPPLGAMIETPGAADDAAGIARMAQFLSIGTNDLTAATLGADRFAVNAARAHHPRVLESISRSVTAAHEAGISIEVCGEAASDPIMLPLLVGLQVDELSVGAARVGQVRDWIRALNAAEAGGLARSALTMDTAEEVEWAVRPLAEELLSAAVAEAPAAPIR